MALKAILIFYLGAGIFLEKSIKGDKSGFPKIEGGNDMYQVVRASHTIQPALQIKEGLGMKLLQGVGTGGGYAPFCAKRGSFSQIYIQTV